MKILTGITIGDGQFTNTDYVKMGGMVIEKGTMLYSIDKKKLIVDTTHVEATGSVDNKPAIKMRNKNGMNYFQIENRDYKRYFIDKQEVEDELQELKGYASRPKDVMNITIAADISNAFRQAVYENNDVSQFRVIERLMEKYIKDTK